jgi:hypothetical protein
MSDEVDPWAEMAIALREPADIERASDLARTIPLGRLPDVEPVAEPDRLVRRPEG